MSDVPLGYKAKQRRAQEDFLRQVALGQECGIPEVSELQQCVFEPRQPGPLERLLNWVFAR